MSNSKIKIEVQHFHGCPNGPAMIANVKEAIAEFDGGVVYSELLVDSNEIAGRIGFRGSPTLIINGEDFEGSPAPERPALNCRIYPNGVPSPDDIRSKIAELM